MSLARAVFVDRDGTIIVDVGYLNDPDAVALLPGAAGAIRRLNDAGLQVVVVTNQSGIAQGLLGRNDFEESQERLDQLLGETGAWLDGVYMCPHHPDVDGPCDCRKPGSALYRQAAADLDIDLARSFYVGDRYRDVAVTEVVGGTPFLVWTGEGGHDAPAAVERVDDLAQAANRILEILSAED